MKRRSPRRSPARAPEPAPEPGTLGAMVEPHLEWMRVKNYSADTVHVRGLYLRYFCAWCGERDVQRPEQVTPRLLESYQRWLYHYRKSTGQVLTVFSQHGRLIAVRGWFRWFSRTGQLASNPAADLELPRISKHRMPENVLSIAEVERVMVQPNVHDELGLRDRAIMEVFYSTGMRRMELQALKLYDLDLDKGTVSIRHGKGDKGRTVPIGERAIAWLGKYLDEVRPQLVLEPDDGVVFINNYGEAFRGEQLTQLVRGHVAASGVARTGACHLFRHTMATLMLENGADIRFIQELLGHAELTTTQIYTRVSIRKLKEIHTATHPGAKLARTRSQEAHEDLDDELDDRACKDEGIEERG